MTVEAGFKQTPIGQIPEDWEVQELSKVSEVIMGQSPKSASYNSEGCGLPLIQGKADIAGRYTAPRTWSTEVTKECKPNDLIVTVRAPVGYIAKSKHNACIGRGVSALRAHSVSSEFLYQFFLKYESEWAKIEQGSTFTAVNSNEIKTLCIPLPPLPEQKKIAEVLSTVDDKIDSIEQEIEQTQTLKKGLMQKLLTGKISVTGTPHTFKNSELGPIPESWEVVKFEEILAERKNSLGYGILQPGTGVANGIPMLRTVDLAENGRADTEILKVPQKVSDTSRSTLLNGGEILLSVMGTLGRCYVVPNEWRGWNVNRALAVIRTNDSINNYFLCHYFRSPIFKAIIEKQALGSAQMRINLSELCKYPVPLPAMPEQEKIAEILGGVDDKLEVLEEKNAKYTTLKKGLMQKLLTGRIRVKEI